METNTVFLCCFINSHYRYISWVVWLLENIWTFTYCSHPSLLLRCHMRFFPLLKEGGGGGDQAKQLSSECYYKDSRPGADPEETKEP